MIYCLFCGFVKAKLIKVAKMEGVMHEVDHAYSVQSTWWLHRVPFMACVIDSLTIWLWLGFVEFFL